MLIDPSDPETAVATKCPSSTSTSTRRLLYVADTPEANIHGNTYGVVNVAKSKHENTKTTTKAAASHQTAQHIIIITSIINIFILIIINSHTQRSMCVHQQQQQ
ncbi:hypothetical protein ACLKA7_015533 [Drosophila subpalustris]